MTNFPETGSTSGVHLETFTIYIYIYACIFICTARVKKLPPKGPGNSGRGE